MRRLTSAEFAKEFRAKMEMHAERIKAEAVARLTKRNPKVNDHSDARKAAESVEKVEIVRAPEHTPPKPLRDAGIG